MKKQFFAKNFGSNLKILFTFNFFKGGKKRTSSKSVQPRSASPKPRSGSGLKGKPRNVSGLKGKRRSVSGTKYQGIYGNPTKGYCAKVYIDGKQIQIKFDKNEDVCAKYTREFMKKALKEGKKVGNPDYGKLKSPNDSSTVSEDTDSMNDSMEVRT